MDLKVERTQPYEREMGEWYYRKSPLHFGPAKKARAKSRKEEQRKTKERLKFEMPTSPVEVSLTWLVLRQPLMCVWVAGHLAAKKGARRGRKRNPCVSSLHQSRTTWTAL